MDWREHIGKWLAWKSNQIGREYKRKQLAHDSGVHYQHISRMMSPKKEKEFDAQVSTIEKLGKGLGVTSGQFLDGPDAFIKRRLKTAGYDNEFLTLSRVLQIISCMSVVDLRRLLATLEMFKEKSTEEEKKKPSPLAGHFFK